MRRVAAVCRMASTGCRSGHFRGTTLRGVPHRRRFWPAHATMLIRCLPSMHGMSPVRRACLAVESDDVSIVMESVLQHGVPLDLNNAAGRPLLAVALHHGSWNVVQWLLQQEQCRLVRSPIPVDDASGAHVYPLHLAAVLGSVKGIEMLVAAGADLEARASDGFTAVAGAASVGQAASVRTLLALGAQPDPGHAPPSPSGQRQTQSKGKTFTPLNAAIVGGHVETASVLVEGGHALDATPAQVAPLAMAMAPLAAAATDANGPAKADAEARGVHATSLRMVRTLLAHGANPNGPTAVAPLTHCVSFVAPILTMALSIQSEALCRELLEHGASASALAMEDGHTPALVHAALHNLTWAVEPFVAAGANVNDRDASGRTALHVAAGLGHVSVVEALLACGALPDAPDADGFTPIMYAIAQEDARVETALLRAGAVPPDIGDA